MRFLLFLLLLAGCSPSTLADLRAEGDAELRKLSIELSKIETKEALQKAAPYLKKKFNKIADLLIEARSFADGEPQEPLLSGEMLFVELARLYEIPGGRELIETTQSEAIRKLCRRR